MVTNCCITRTVQSEECLYTWACSNIRAFLGGPVVKNLPATTGDVGSIPGSRRSPGEGNGNPFQYSCLGNPTDKRSLLDYSPWACKRGGHDLATEQQHSNVNLYTHLRTIHRSCTVSVREWAAPQSISTTTASRRNQYAKCRACSPSHSVGSGPAVTERPGGTGQLSLTLGKSIFNLSRPLWPQTSDHGLVWGPGTKAEQLEQQRP